MDSISHSKQRILWEHEHKKPSVLKQMDSDKPSSGVLRFFGMIKDIGSAKGIEMCCGKGRNVIWLARNGIDMTGFDFSKNAISEARRRARAAKVDHSVKLLLQDATRRWKSESGSFDFAIDCFASTDIESYEGRSFARDEAVRVLKPGGLLMVYALSTEDEFHRNFVRTSQLQEKNAFLHPMNGKFSKTYGKEEFLEFYSGLKLIEFKRIRKYEIFFGKRYKCNHIWAVFRK